MFFLRRKSPVAAILFSLNIQTVLAGQLFNVEQYDSFLTIIGGANFINTGYDQTLLFPLAVQNSYRPEKSWNTVANVGGGLGVERVLTPNFSAQLGVSAYANSVYSPHGNVLQVTPAGSQEFQYAYTVQSTSVMLTGKFLATLASYQCIRPYFSWEAGAGFNRPNGYHETILTTPFTPVRNVYEDTKASFAWGLGLGMDYIVNRHIRAGVGYQFANLGSVSLGLVQNGSNISTLALPHLYTNQLRFQLTFLV